MPEASLEVSEHFSPRARLWLAARVVLATGLLVALLPGARALLADHAAIHVDAGPDRLVSPRTEFSLIGSVTPQAAGTLRYEWRQLSGPPAELRDAATARPTVTAGPRGDVYLFSLVVKRSGAFLGNDLVVVAVRDAGTGINQARAQLSRSAPLAAAPYFAAARPALTVLNFSLAAAAVLAMFSFLLERASQLVRQSRLRSWWLGLTRRGKETLRVQLMHFQTGESVAGVIVRVVTEDGRVVARDTTDGGGHAAVSLKTGTYRLDFLGSDFTNTAVHRLELQKGETVYSGGSFRVGAVDEVVDLIVPMKPIGMAAASATLQKLRAGQAVQRLLHVFIWPVFVAGALLNTALMLWSAMALYFGLEILYVGLVLLKIVLDVRWKPSFGTVRDAITHVPLDLAVVRLYEAGSNRLVLTRATDGQGRFLAAPPPGRYNVVVSKTGYETFAQEGVSVAPGRDHSLGIKASLMPLAARSFSSLLSVR